MFFTSDTHFGHTNLVKNGHRNFLSTQEMDEIIIERWNTKIGIKALVFHIGGFKWNHGKVSDLLPRLHGKVILVKGNHDYKLKAWEFELFHSVHDILYLKSENIFMCHYPMLTWHKMAYGIIHLHGHSHGSLKKRKNVLDVGVDTNDFHPYSLEEIRELVKI